MLEEGIQQLVDANSAVQAILGNDPVRFYPTILPARPAYPCATYQVISDIPEYVLGGAAGIEIKRIQIDTWSGGTDGASYGDTKNAMAAIRAVLDGFSGPLPDGTRVAGIFVANGRDEFEQDARAYRCSMDILVHFYPAAG